MTDIIGTNSGDTLAGDGDNDLIRGLAGNDTIDGGAGNDTIFGGGGTNILTGGAGNDVFGIEARSLASNGGSQIHDIQDFTLGEDLIDLSVLNVASFEALDQFLTQSLDDLFLTFEHDGLIEQFILRDVSFNDLSAADFIFNTDNADLTVVPTGRSFTDNVLFGGNGNDTITSNATGDVIIDAGAGNDTISANLGTNIVTGGAGDDEFVTTANRDFFTTNTTITDFEIGSDQLNVSNLNVSTLEDLMPFLSQDGNDVVLTTIFDGALETYRLEDTQLSDLTASDFIFNTDATDLDVTADGRSFADFTLFGGSGDDDITGALTGDNTLVGGAGDDELTAGFGTNILRGGEGNDDFNIRSRDFFSTNTTIEDFVIGEDQLDVRVLNVGDLTTLMPFLRQVGDDVVLTTVFDGASEVYRLENVQLSDLSESDFVFNDINQDLTVNAGGRSFTDYTLFGGNGNDTINAASSFSGNALSNLNGGAGDDELNGGNNRDILNGGAGADELNGGSSFDQASYITASTAVNINLATGVTSGDQAVGDTFNSVEGIIGSQFGDVLTGTDIAGRFDGLGGDDIIVTGESGDNFNVANGGSGNDTITGGSTRDEINGGSGDDIINGGDGVDTITGGAGNDRILLDNDLSDTIDAGEGVDTLVLEEAFLFIQEPSSFFAPENSFELANSANSRGTIDFTGSFANFEFIEVEGITFSIDAAEVSQTRLRADTAPLLLSDESEVVQFFDLSGSNVLGLSGNDYLISVGGSHGLFGGAGQDYLVGNSGNDTLSGDTAFALTGIEGDVYRAFQAVFARDPDVGGFNAFVQEIRLGNLTQETVIAEFVDSPEFQNTFGTLDNRAFIEQLFLNIFDREASTTDVNAFAGTLDQGRTRADVVVELANSAEFIQATTVGSSAFATNVIFNPLEGAVYRTYQATLGRQPDDEGFLLFTNSIAANVLTLEDVIEEFIASPEFVAAVGGPELPNAQFIENLFTNVLPGNQDQVGRDAFTAALDSGELTRVQVVEEFVNSLEFRNATNQDTLDFVRQVENGNSDDILNGGTGDDFLVGGGGDDIFIYNVEADDQDIIADFVAGDAGGDIIRIEENDAFNSLADLLGVASQEGANVFFNFGDGNTLTLNNVTLGDLNSGDFEFLGEDMAVISATAPSQSVSDFDNFLEDAEIVDVNVDALI